MKKHLLLLVAFVFAFSFMGIMQCDPVKVCPNCLEKDGNGDCVLRSVTPLCACYWEDKDAHPNKKDAPILKDCCEEIEPTPSGCPVDD